MTTRSVTHASFTLERNYPASPARVFAAWSDLRAKARWFAGPDEWENSEFALDFRVGGLEMSSGGPSGGPIHRFEARYQEIVPNERIIYTYDMSVDNVRLSISLATVEFKPEGDGTRLVLTEQGAFLDGHDAPSERERGTVELLEALNAELMRVIAEA